MDRLIGRCAPTDQPVHLLLDKNLLIAILQNWKLRIFDFRFKIHKKGIDNVAQLWHII
jgi:hypothetical protein